MQHHAGPAAAEHDIHFAGGSRNSLKIHQRLSDRFIDCALPGLRVDEPVKTFAPAESVTARFLSVAVSSDHSNIESHHGANVAIGLSIGTQDFHHLPGGSDARGDLPHPRIFLTRVGIH